jgi:hypothetical protein
MFFSGAFEGRICPSTDIDFYAFTIENAGTYAFEFELTQGILYSEFSFSVLTPDNELVNMNSTVYVNYTSILLPLIAYNRQAFFMFVDAFLQPGLYYVKIYSLFGTQSAYSLQVYLNITCKFYIVILNFKDIDSLNVKLWILDHFLSLVTLVFYCKVTFGENPIV